MEEEKKEEAPNKKKEEKTAKPVKEHEIMGKYLLRDMPLFKHEIILYVLIAFAVFFVSVLERLAVAPGATAKIAIPALLVPVGIWIVKWWFYMPNKKRVPSLRIYKSGVIEIGVDDISKGFITYGKGEDAQRKYVTKLNKHTEASTGKPFLITSEVQGENLSLIESTKPDMKSEEFNAILDTNTAVVTKKVMARMLNFAKPSLENPMFLIIALNIALTGVLLAKEFGILDMFKGG
jgi:hypothetical protein